MVSLQRECGVDFVKNECQDHLQNVKNGWGGGGRGEAKNTIIGFFEMHRFYLLWILAISSATTCQSRQDVCFRVKIKTEGKLRLNMSKCKILRKHIYSNQWLWFLWFVYSMGGWSRLQNRVLKDPLHFVKKINVIYGKENLNFSWIASAQLRNIWG